MGNPKGSDNRKRRGGKLSGPSRPRKKVRASPFDHIAPQAPKGPEVRTSSVINDHRIRSTGSSLSALARERATSLRKHIARERPHQMDRTSKEIFEEVMAKSKEARLEKTRSNMELVAEVARLDELTTNIMRKLPKRDTSSMMTTDEADPYTALTEQLQSGGRAAASRPMGPEDQIRQSARLLQQKQEELEATAHAKQRQEILEELGTLDLAAAGASAAAESLDVGYAVADDLAIGDDSSVPDSDDVVFEDGEEGSEPQPGVRRPLPIGILGEDSSEEDQAPEEHADTSGGLSALPFVLPVPGSYAAFLSLCRRVSEQEELLLLDRLIKTNSSHIDKANTPKMERLGEFLLQRFKELSAVEPGSPRISAVARAIRHVCWEVTPHMGVVCKEELSAILEAHIDGGNPNRAALLVIRLMPRIFPAPPPLPSRVRADLRARSARHPVLSPALLLVDMLAHRLQIQAPADVLTGILLAQIGASFLIRSRRVLPSLPALLARLLAAIGNGTMGKGALDKADAERRLSLEMVPMDRAGLSVQASRCLRGAALSAICDTLTLLVELWCTGTDPLQAGHQMFAEALAELEHFKDQSEIITGFDRCWSSISRLPADFPASLRWLEPKMPHVQESDPLFDVDFRPGRTMDTDRVRAAAVKEASKAKKAARQELRDAVRSNREQVSQKHQTHLAERERQTKAYNQAMSMIEAEAARGNEMDRIDQHTKRMKQAERVSRGMPS
eukprot:gnl/Dysnectes_brevis/1001_a1116_1491.p1 GENE.gnl/Dysnectes_brevis/1001_a1116_1491~~gnl/Dysnectes_brevis/1001_a1116_1491.p1  ORF type:complete len:731 (+),score=277.30 gnl/Dysnectes_brevis/1001_a1116_1491:134-2326(+)